MNRRCLVPILAAGILYAADATKQFTADELKQYLEKNGKKVFFLDVREPKEIQELGSIKGYVNIPLSQVESRLSEIPKDRTVVTACNRGVRAGKAAEILRKNGYNVVGACGLLEWKDKGYPLDYPKQRGGK
jgi:rhodanese-related sulfurtransferase